MGNQDAPKAPAGWYPIGDDEIGERYWDGKAWTGETRGTESTELDKKTKNIEVAAHTKWEKSNKSKQTKSTSFLAGFTFWKTFLLVVVVSLVWGILDFWSIFFSYSLLVLLIALVIWLGIITFSKNTPSPPSRLSRLLIFFVLVPSVMLTGLFSGNALSESIYVAVEEQQEKLKLAEAEEIENEKLEAEKQAKAKAANEKLVAEQKAAAAAAAEAAKNARIPEGFEDAGNGLAYTFIDGTCGYTSCAYLQVYAYESCRSVYVEANMVDSNGLIYGPTNDLLGQLNEGDSAVATLLVYENGATGVKLTEVTCNSY